MFNHTYPMLYLSHIGRLLGAIYLVFDTKKQAMKNNTENYTWTWTIVLHLFPPKRKGHWLFRHVQVILQG